ncbi:DDE-type integrase/transposase/recombinase [Dactylosporangium cerinum]
MPARTRRQVVHRRNLRQGQRRLAVRVPAVDQHSQVIDVLVSARRDAAAARRFFRRAMTTLKVQPTEVVTDATPVYPAPSTRWSRRRGTTSNGIPTTK